MTTLVQLFGLLFLAAAFVKLFPWLLGIALAYGGYRFVRSMVAETRALNARIAAADAAVRERADRQVDWFQSGDPRWVTGEGEE
jgi:hypothetical protein